MLSSAGLDADALLAPLAREPALLLAVSGGPDSTALMLLAARWSLRAERHVAVATVDHGLREDSREEAERVRAWAKALGFAHHLLSWTGPKPATRIQEQARDARYDLLRACARSVAPDCAVVTAHHADDQAETVLFRLLRGSGVAGLAGMAAETTREGVRLLRPLLGVSKAELVSCCDAAGHPYFCDPSNENEMFARARLRRLGATLAEEGLTAQGLLRLRDRAARAEEALAFAASKAARDAERASPADEIRLAADALRELPVELLQRVLAISISRLDGALPRRLDRLERAAQVVRRSLNEAAPARFTLGGALVSLQGDELVLRRAPPRRRVDPTQGQEREKPVGDA